MLIWVKPGEERKYPAEISKIEKAYDAKVKKDKRKYDYPADKPQELHGIRKLITKNKRK